MKKRIISLVLSLLLIIGLVPMTAFPIFAEDDNSVYISISNDGRFCAENDGTAVAYKKIALEELADINLDSYGLGDYVYDGDGDQVYDITALHLFIYVHENVLCLPWGGVTVSGNAGSIYFQSGLFGFEDENLTYYYNGAYPEIEPGWGATADQIVLSAGDFLDVANYSNWAFYMDTAAGFHYFVDADGNVTHQYEAQAGTACSIKLQRVGGGFGGDAVTVNEPGYKVYYGTSVGNPAQLTDYVTTSNDGTASLTFDAAGTYYIWCEGAEGKDAGVDEIVSAPASAVITVTEPSIQKADYKTVLNDTLAQLATDVSAPKFGTSGGEWTVISLARGGYFDIEDKYFEDYYARVAETIPGLEETALKAGKQAGALDKNKSTENSRLIMALAAIGRNPKNVGGVDVLGAYDANGFDWIKKQGINGPIFTLIALDTNDYPTTDTTLRQQCIDFILGKELTSGGWALSGTAADPDITSMALQALVNYKDDATVSAAANRAIDALSSMQKDNGGFASWGSVNSESIAQVITALSAWGIDADKDSRFVKNGTSALDALLGFYLPEAKGFAHVLSTSGPSSANAMATDQDSYALVAYDRFVNGKTSLYDMSDVEKIKTIFDNSEEIAAALALPEKIENKVGTEFNAVVNLNGFATGNRLLDCIISVPEGVSVSDITMGSRIKGGEVSWYFEEATGKLRIVYCDTQNGKAITITGTDAPLELMTIGFEIEKVLSSNTVDIAITGMSMKGTSESESQNIIKTEAATDTSELVDGVSFSAMTLYTGDDVDLISKDKTAIAVAVTGVDAGTKLTYKKGEASVTMLYNGAISEKTGVSTYLAMISSSEKLEDYIDETNYVIEKGNSAEFVFGDTNNDRNINAQDALNVVNYWLRKTPVETDETILVANVTGDSRINTFDVLGIIESFVDGKELAIINQAATVKSTGN